jgi:hypothetical protein
VRLYHSSMGTCVINALTRRKSYCGYLVNNIKLKRVIKGAFMNNKSNKVAIALYSIIFCIMYFFFLPTGVQGANTDYPERAITLICPYPPGGITDLGARALKSK